MDTGIYRCANFEKVPVPISILFLFNQILYLTLLIMGCTIHQLDP